MHLTKSKMSEQHKQSYCDLFPRIYIQSSLQKHCNCYPKRIYLRLKAQEILTKNLTVGVKKHALESNRYGNMSCGNAFRFRCSLNPIYTKFLLMCPQ